MHTRAIVTIFITGIVIIAAEYTGQRRQAIIARVAMFMLFLTYALWKFSGA